METYGRLIRRGNAPDDYWECRADGRTYPMNLQKINENARFGWEPRFDMEGLTAKVRVVDEEVVEILFGPI